MCRKIKSYVLRSILLTAALFVTFVSISDPPPLKDPPPTMFKTERARALMNPFLWNLAVSVGPCVKRIVITASQNGKHRRDSQHYQNKALDFRTKHLTKKERTQFSGCVKAVLGDSYFVKLESNHLHVALLAEPQ